MPNCNYLAHFAVRNLNILTGFRKMFDNQELRMMCSRHNYRCFCYITTAYKAFQIFIINLDNFDKKCDSVIDSSLKLLFLTVQFV